MGGHTGPVLYTVRAECFLGICVVMSPLWNQAHSGPCSVKTQFLVFLRKQGLGDWPHPSDASGADHCHQE